MGNGGGFANVHSECGDRRPRSELLCWRLAASSSARRTTNKKRIVCTYISMKVSSFGPNNNNKEKKRQSLKKKKHFVLVPSIVPPHQKTPMLCIQPPQNVQPAPPSPLFITQQAPTIPFHRPFIHPCLPPSDSTSTRPSPTTTPAGGREAGATPHAGLPSPPSSAAATGAQAPRRPSCPLLLVAAAASASPSCPPVVAGPWASLAPGRRQTRQS
jgi:hypothetical protein